MPCSAPQLPELHARRPGIERVGLVEPDDLPLFGKAVTVDVELLADCAISAGDILDGSVDQVEDHRAALDMTEKPRANSRTLAGTLDQTREVGQREFLVVDSYDAELRLQGRERVVGDLGPGVRDRGKEGRLAGIRQADETDIGDQLQAQPDPGLMAGPAGIGAPRRAIGRALVMRVAETAIAALQEDPPLAGTSEVGEHLPVLGIHDLGPDRDRQDEIVTVRAGALAPSPRPAGRCPEVLAIAVVDQGVEIVRRGKDDVAALAAVTTVGAAELDELLAAKARGPAPAVTALQVDLALVEELHGASTAPRMGCRLGRLLGGLRWLRDRRHDRDIGTAGAAGVEFDRTAQCREQRMVAADADMRPRVELGAALAHDDVAGHDDLAAELLDAEPPSAAVAPVARGATRLLMRHPSLLPDAADRRRV